MSNRWFTHREILTRETEETFLPPGLGGLLTDVLDDAVRTPVPIPGEHSPASRTGANE
ncbi:hypothetical protein JQS43_06945 [Natronosporangium hydrolyticum]|uniref:Uncharacterized protein n=1 Tax=Natronosporangium hydrolyticum TaxID=2811111 RepID=A0A895YL63_9ACTN|nr:hypothetical protein [Natronosporangium hydrolyticum]QSB16043.1 hypothetical protein JQS43_06945 [Natronosporangium hydrolyticum]